MRITDKLDKIDEKIEIILKEQARQSAYLESDFREINRIAEDSKRNTVFRERLVGVSKLIGILALLATIVGGISNVVSINTLVEGKQITQEKK